MKLRSSLAVLAAATASVNLAAAAPQLQMDAWAQTSFVGDEICVEIDGAPDSLFAVWVSFDGSPTFDSNTARPLAHGTTRPDGKGFLEIPFDRSRLPDNFGVHLFALMRAPGGFDVTPQALPLVGSGSSLCQTFDPNFEIGPDVPVAGEFMNDQWSAVNMTISGVGNSGPDAVIVFDSANPTGNDPDLATPGPGVANTTALGNLLILPGDVVDANGDGLVDDPCDNANGGVMRFDFAEPYRMCSATIVDSDESPSELRFYIGNSMTLETIPIANIGDNSVQTITFDKADVRRFEVALAGSGAVARLEMVPCPLVVNLDESPFGVPRGDAAGEVITNQYEDLGLIVSAVNNTPGNPDKAILFDSENPTGDDFDLMTPGPGLNNTEGLGLVLIIAENDVDADMNGLVDDPDDEAGGGQFQLTFTEDVVFFSGRVLDVDGAELDEFRFFDAADNLIQTVEINALGENSVQQIVAGAPIQNVRRIEVNLVGSGALARLRWCPVSNFSSSAP